MSLIRIKQKIPLVLIFLGIIVMLIGLYYIAGKAGIPYQDPTPELSQKYNNYMKIGHKLCKSGLVIGFIGIIIWTIQKLINKLLGTHY